MANIVKIKAVLIQVDGTSKEVTLTGNTLRELQKLVGGYIEVVSGIILDRPDIVMVINEEGKLMGLPTNIIASILYGDTIVGDAILIGERNGDFDTLSNWELWKSW